ncbi:CPBP family intramembrane glutamic endopeptidase [Leptothermofonsia sichuanensis]|uniref:CPBP family intramembrane glutamic endopeptidase n=1 Tax=Leptothermofonsia sichuanensis TaxID=2917832 RepID=UPI001CED7EBB|nr:CPBP family intramembrane glutamic endopeptidase [Leptothermofonsia sichuanensis]
MAEQFPENPEFEPLSRTQVLIAMGVTAIVLLLIARLWMQLGSVPLLSFQWSAQALWLGLGLGLGITAASSLVYYTWSAYRQSADYYLELVLKPLVWPDLIWLGLLPGLSEELLFRGVMLPAFGLNIEGVLLSSLCFGVLHLSSLKQWPYVVWATVIGLALGASAIETGNLLVPIVAHISTNWISSSLWKWGEKSRG